MDTKRKKVYVALSGGVDSSVSAALLKEATINNFEKLFGRPAPKGFRGYDVTGVFMNVWQPDFIKCSRDKDRHDAMRAAAHLNIPFLVYDLEKEYKEEVVDYMIREYREGRTPNPDVMCNKHVKFGAYFKKALSSGADYIATGHYARIGEGNTLLAGTDKNKDQTYFLWTLTHKQLEHTLFPIGGLQKSEVRRLAKKFGLPNAERKESQGVCFLGKFDMKEFLSHYIPKERGSVVNSDGEVIGYHEGAFFYTLGQRHGFIITKKTPEDEPYYVVEKNSDANTITVSHKREKLEYSTREIHISDTSFILGEDLDFNKEYQARIRYRQPLQECTLKKETGGILKVIFKESQTSVAIGQSLVIYDGEVCCGGGIITKGF